MGDCLINDNKVKKLPIAIIPATIIMLLALITSIYCFRLFGFTFKYEPVIRTAVLLNLLVYCSYLITLHLKSRLLINISVILDILVTIFLYIVIKDLRLKYPNFISVNISLKLCLLIILPKLVVLFVGLTQFNKGTKKYLYVIMLISIIISDFLLYVSTQNIVGSSNIDNVIYTLYILLIYWFLEPYKEEEEPRKVSFTLLTLNMEWLVSPCLRFIKRFNRKKSILTVCILLSIVFIGTNLKLNYFYSKFEYTDEEIAYYEEIAFTEDKVINEMASLLEFNGEPFGLPRKANDLPEGLYVEKMFPIGISKEHSILPYDVNCALLYNNEFIGFIDKVPGEDGEIFSIMISDDYKMSEFFTVGGIGVGSTEEELVERFPNYVKDEDTLSKEDKTKEDKTKEYEEASEIYIYMDEEYQKTQERNGYVAFKVEDGIVISIIIQPHLFVF